MRVLWHNFKLVSIYSTVLSSSSVTRESHAQLVSRGGASLSNVPWHSTYSREASVPSFSTLNQFIVSIIFQGFLTHSSRTISSDLSCIMFEDTIQFPLSVRHRILLMSVTMTLSNLALCITKNSRVYLFEQAQCLLYYQSHGPTQVDIQNSINESLCKVEDIQYPLSIIVGIDSFLSLLPGKAFWFSFSLSPWTIIDNALKHWIKSVC